ncbi:MAG: SusC/RagA family TonB-linked outer membrane protein [Bacteroidota bacterium]
MNFCKPIKSKTSSALWRGLLFCLLSIGSLGLYAQTLSGTITDAENKEALEGARVMVANSTTGAITDANGKFSLTLPEGAETIIVDYFGYTRQRIAINGQSVINVALVSDAASLDDVVITALGIARDEKTLGYAAQELEGSSMTQAREPNFINAMSGRVAGVNITQGASGVGSSARMVIRGETSISGNNQPLFVVDGVPISNDIFSTRSEGNLEVDYGNAASEINPDDIEAVTVLKGANATALYGSRALNGVVLITTKSGRGQKGIGVSVNSTTSFENPLRIPQYQNEYGQGANGEFSFVDGSGSGVNDGVDESWGPRLDQGLNIPQHDSPTSGGFRGGDSHPSINRGEVQATPWTSAPDNIRNFFETGITTTNNVAIAGGNENGDFRLSFTNLWNKGIVPNTDLKRNNISLSTSFKPIDKLTFRINANYVDTDSDNRPTNSYGTENVMYLWVWFGRQIQMNSLQDYWQPGLEGVQQYNYNYNWHDNPYFTQFENTNGLKKDRLFGNMSVNYEFTDKLSLQLRSGTDYFSEVRVGKRAFSTQRFPFGQYREDLINFQETNTDLLLTYQDLYSGDFGYSVSVGANRMDQNRRYLRISANQLSVPEVYNFENSRIPLTQTQFNTARRINSVYATAQFSFKNSLFLDVSGRNDWSSSLTLPDGTGNNSYFYPAANLSAVISEMTDLPASITFLKLRAGYGEVGGDADPYRLTNVYNYLTPWGGTQRVTENNALANANLRPERARSFEAGVDFRMFDNRLGIDVAYFNTNVLDQIFALDIPQSTGFSSQIVNAGKINSYGFEVQLNATPIQRDNGFRWDINANWSLQRSRVVELVEGIENYTIASNYMIIQAREGGRMGDMYGTGFVMIKDGERLFPDELGRLPEGGQPLMNDNGFYERDNNLRYLGNYNPDWMLGLYNSFSYKGFNLGFLFDLRYGGMVMSRTLLIGGTSGMMVETIGDNDRGNPKRDPVDQGGGVAPEGVFQDTDGNYIDNYSLPEDQRKRLSGRDFYWWTFNRGNESQGMYDATYLKLREVRLGYDFPAGLTSRIGIKDLRLSLVGRNLLLWTENPHFDPETFSFNGGTIVPGVEDMATPTTRSLGINLSFQF